MWQISPQPGNTKGGSITVPLTSCLTGFDKSVSQIKTKIASCHTADSKPVKQGVNRTVILPPLAFPALTLSITIKNVTPCITTLSAMALSAQFGYAECGK
jgi:hypothetical protein